MKIGLVTTWFERGAAIVSRYYRDLFEQNNIPTFIFARDGEQYAKGDKNWDSPNVHWSKKYPGTAINWKEFKKWIVVNNIDLLIFNEQHYWPTIAFAVKELGIPVGAYVDYYTSITVPFFRIYDFLICNTLRHYGVFNWHPQAKYISWGTDIDKFKPLEKSFIDESKPITFFHSAGMNPKRKGTFLAIKAFLELKGNYRFIIHAQEGCNNISEIRNLINSDNRISLIYKTVPAPGLYSLGDIYVYPAVLDGLGLTIAEALASGLPVITTNNAPMNEFINTGINGLLVDVLEYRGRYDGYYWAESYCDIKSLTEAMAFFSSYEIIRTYQNNARIFAEEKLNFKKNALVMVDWLREIKPLPYESKIEAIDEGLKYSRPYSRFKKILYYGFPKKLIGTHDLINHILFA